MFKHECCSDCWLRIVIKLTLQDLFFVVVAGYALLINNRFALGGFLVKVPEQQPREVWREVVVTLALWQYMSFEVAGLGLKGSK